MPSAFDNNDFKHYQDMFLLFSDAEPLVCEHLDSSLTNEAFQRHIEQAEREHKVAVFHHVDFEEIYLSHRDFFVPIVFSKCRFKDQLKLTNNQFFYKLFFHSVIFDGMVKFRLSHFYNGVSFLDSSFKQNASFERVKFLPSNIKYSAREYLEIETHFNAFHGNNTVDFLGVEFGGETTFVNSYFGCSVLFSHYSGRSTKFHDECDFSCITEEKEQFSLTLYGEEESDRPPKEIEILLDRFHRISFVDVEFFGELTFENRIFQKKTIFKDSTFHKAPKFHNAVLHQDTDFRGADFRDTYSEGAERAYRSLKLMMDTTRARREEGMFFALEQKTILSSPLRASRFKIVNTIRYALDRLIKKAVFGKNQPVDKKPPPVFDPDTVHYSGFYVSLTEKLVSFIYFLTSNYGQSLKRPVIIMMISLFAVFPLIYYVSFGHSTLVKHSVPIAYQISFQQMFRPFEIYAVRFRENYADVPISFYMIASTQSLVNLGLLMIFVLAVRGRFRMY